MTFSSYYYIYILILLKIKTKNKKRFFFYFFSIYSLRPTTYLIQCPTPSEWIRGPTIDAMTMPRRCIAERSQENTRWPLLCILFVLQYNITFYAENISYLRQDHDAMALSQQEKWRHNASKRRINAQVYIGA